MWAQDSGGGVCLGLALKPELKQHLTRCWGSSSAGEGTCYCGRWTPEVLSDDEGVSVGSLLLLESAPRIWTRKHIPSLHSCLYFLLVETNQKLGASDWENGTCKSLDSQNGAENNRWMIVQAYLLSGTLSASEHSRRSSIWLFEYLSFLFEKGNRSGAFYPGWIGSFAQGFCISTRWSQRPVLKG